MKNNYLDYARGYVSNKTFNIMKRLGDLASFVYYTYSSMRNDNKISDMPSSFRPDYSSNSGLEEITYMDNEMMVLRSRGRFFEIRKKVLARRAKGNNGQGKQIVIDVQGYKPTIFRF